MDKATKDRMRYDAQVYLRYRKSRGRRRQNLAQSHLGRFAGVWATLDETERTDLLAYLRQRDSPRSQIDMLAEAINRWFS